MKDWTRNYDVVDPGELELEGESEAEVAAVLALYNQIQREALRAYFPVDPAKLPDCECWVSEYTGNYTDIWLEKAWTIWNSAKEKE